MDTRYPVGLVKWTTYPEYSVNYISPHREAQGKITSWNLHPNPAQDQIIIKWRKENGAGGSHRLVWQALKWLLGQG